jgi:hypothetical protein
MTKRCLAPDFKLLMQLHADWQQVVYAGVEHQTRISYCCWNILGGHYSTWRARYSDHFNAHELQCYAPKSDDERKRTSHFAIVACVIDGCVRGQVCVMGYTRRQNLSELF